MREFLTKHKIGILGIFLGGILGFAYYFFIGCETGTCAITSKPFNSSDNGMDMGYLMFSMFDNSKIQKEA